MKYSSFLIIFILLLFSFQTTIHAEGSTSKKEQTVFETYKKVEEQKTSPSENVTDGPSSNIFPIFLKFIFSFALVIGLLFLLLRFLSKRNGLLQSNGPILPLGGHALGNNRSLQAILIGQTIYIIGVGEDINVIRTISKGEEEYQRLLESYENQPDVLPTSWIPNDLQNWINSDLQKKWVSVFQNQLQKIMKLNKKE